MFLKEIFINSKTPHKISYIDISNKYRDMKQSNKIKKHFLVCMRYPS